MKSPKSELSQSKNDGFGDASQAGDDKPPTQAVDERVLRVLEQMDNQEKTKNQDEQNKTISEESFTEEDLSGDDVQNFLRDLGPDT